MAKKPARKLKVFLAQLGFYDTVVAAPSQAAALRAWGVHQNLFKDGLARSTEDPQAVEAALASPETPLRRAVGSSDPFSLKPSPPRAPNFPKERKPAKPKPEPQPRKPPADRTKLDQAEAAMRSLDEARKEEEAEFRRRLDELKAEQMKAQDAYVEARKSANAAIADARRAYRSAGGRD